MRISKIQSEKRNRFRLLLEDGRTLTVTERELISFSLRPGVLLTEEQLEEISISASESTAKSQAARMIGSRPLSKAELYQKLRNKGQTEMVAQAVVDELEAAAIIDDTRYAATLAQHYAMRNYGPRKVEEELRRRGIDRTMWEAALLEGPEPAERAARYLLKKVGPGGLSEDQKDRARVLNGLRRRGFSWNDIEGGLRLYNEWTEHQ